MVVWMDRWMDGWMDGLIRHWVILHYIVIGSINLVTKAVVYANQKD